MLHGAGDLRIDRSPTSPPSAPTTCWSRSTPSASAARTCTTSPPAATGRTCCGNRPCSATRHPASSSAAGARARRRGRHAGRRRTRRRLRHAARPAVRGATTSARTGTCFGSPPTHGTSPDTSSSPPGPSIRCRTADHRSNSVRLIEPLAVAVWAVQRAEVGLRPPGADHRSRPDRHPRRPGGTGRGRRRGDRHRRERRTGSPWPASSAPRGGQHRDAGPANSPAWTGCSSARPTPPRSGRGIRTLKPAARATVVGQAAPTVDGLPLAHLQRCEIDLVTAFRYAHAFPTAIALAAVGRGGPLVHPHRPLPARPGRRRRCARRSRTRRTSRSSSGRTARCLNIHGRHRVEAARQVRRALHRAAPLPTACHLRSGVPFVPEARSHSRRHG